LGSLHYSSQHNFILWLGIKRPSRKSVLDIKKYSVIQNDMLGLCPIQKNGAIQKDLVTDNKWFSIQIILVVWAPL